MKIPSITSGLEAAKGKAEAVELAIGAAINRRPKLTFWVLLIAALAGAKIISGAMR